MCACGVVEGIRGEMMGGADRRRAAEAATCQADLGTGHTPMHNHHTQPTCTPTNITLLHVTHLLRL